MYELFEKFLVQFLGFYDAPFAYSGPPSDSGFSGFFCYSHYYSAEKIGMKTAMPPLIFLQDFILFPYWWFIRVPLFGLKFVRKLTVYLNHSLAVTLMLRTLLLPLFGDFTLFGFLFGFVFRLLRALLGMAVIFLVGFFSLFILTGWLAAPFFLFLRTAFPAEIAAFFFLLALFKGLGQVSLRLRQAYVKKEKEREARRRLELPEGENPKEADFAAVLKWLADRWEREHPPFLWEERYRFGPLGGVNRTWTGRVTPDLDRYSLDLTREAQGGRLPLLIGKEKPLASLIRALEKESGNSVLLVGPSGCGKTSLVLGLAQEIVRGARSPALSGKRLISLEIGALIAGTKSGGDLQERMQAVLRDIEASGKSLLFIDEVHNVIAAGGGVDTSLIFSALEPHLSAGRLQIIGATNWENYRRYIEPNEAFARLFTLVEIEEATFEETLRILEHLSGRLERKYRLAVSYPALRQAIALATRFITERALPDKAVATLEEAVVYASHYKKPGDLLTGEDVAKFITEKTNVPVTEINQNEAGKLLRLEEAMHQRLIGQSEAISAIADAIRRARVGLRDPRRPIASLLFVGPTGVGKTEAAKTLAAVFFGREDRLLAFDMSEYQREDSVNRLIGAPPGPGQVAPLGLLTEKVRQHPYSLVLFDEAEKAHPRILDVFLQVLEEGRLTDAAGLTVNFTNTLLIFTSNAGADLIYRSLREGRLPADLNNDLFSFLQGSFRIELLNRFDGVVAFSPLTLPQISQIVRLKLNKLVQQMAAKGITLCYDDSLVEAAAHLGFDPALGARPLRRLIQDKIESYLAKAMLSGHLGKGQSLTLRATALNN